MSINSCALILAGYQSIYCENGPEVCASSACPGDAMFVHARLSCRCSHISWHACTCISNSFGEFVPEVEDFI